MKPNFKNDLKRGDAGERFFLTMLPGARKVPASHRDDYDFELDGRRFEIKTDFYPEDMTPNFFIESVSNKAKGTPGGPFRCPPDTIYIYFFYHTRHYYLFRAGDLATATERLVRELRLKPHLVENPNHFTIGYRVPRRALLAVCAHATDEVSQLDATAVLGWDPGLAKSR